MRRVAPRFDVEPIGRALDLIPPGIRRRVEFAHFVCGVDSVFAGLALPSSDEPHLHHHAHVLWDVHQQHRPRADRAPHVILPGWDHLRTGEGAAGFYPSPVVTVVHELGHILDEQIGWDRCGLHPVSGYRYDQPDLSEWEAFAEAFALRVCPDDLLAPLNEHGWGYDRDLLESQPWALSLFDELNGGPWA